MPAKRIAKRKTIRRAKSHRRGLLFWRIALAAPALLGAAVLIFLAQTVGAQVWSEPTTFPPGDNAPPPIWNQTALDQAAGFRINGNALIGGRIGIGKTNPSYALDSAGTLRATGTATDAAVIGSNNSGTGVSGTSVNGFGVVGFSDTVTGISGSSTTGSGVVGASDSGTGVYGSSVSGYAGYFSGNVNVTDQLTRGGVNVCLEDGTNCPSASAKAPIRYMSGTTTCPSGYSVGSAYDGEAYWQSNYGSFCHGTTFYQLQATQWTSTSGGCASGRVCRSDNAPVIYMSGTTTCPSGYTAGSVADGEGNWSSNFGSFCIGTTLYQLLSNQWSTVFSGCSAPGGAVCVKQ